MGALIIWKTVWEQPIQNITNLSNNLDNLANQTWKLQVNSDSATNSAIKSTDTVNIHSGKNIKLSKHKMPVTHII